MTVPYPDPVMISALAALPAVAALKGRISTTLNAALPACRVTKVRDHEAPSDWEATPIYQIEVWAADEFKAGEIAWAIKNQWPTAQKQVIGAALVTHRWIDLDPYHLADPDTHLSRYLIHVGLRLSGVPA